MTTTFPTPDDDRQPHVADDLDDAALDLDNELDDLDDEDDEDDEADDDQEPIADDPDEGELGQATTEYALVLLGAALVALLLIAWATSGGGAGKVGHLLDAVLDAITAKL